MTELKTELDMGDYASLGGPARLALDQWMQEEDLARHSIIWFRIGDGYVDADCLVDKEAPDGEKVYPEIVRKRLKVRTSPPEISMREYSS